MKNYSLIKVLSVLIIMTLALSLCRNLAFAESNSKNVGSIETEEALASAPVSISASVSKAIPETTPLLNDGVVSGGQPTYRITVLYKFTSPASFNGAASFSVENVISDGTEAAGTVLGVSGTACGLEPTYSTTEKQYLYTHTVVYHIRNTKSFNIQCEIHGANNEKKTTTVLLTLPTAYDKQFEVTYYYFVKEAQCNGTRNTTASGISGKKYKKEFLEDVKMEGSGYTQDGEYIQYEPTTKKYRIVPYPQTASGTRPEVGRTIAVDNTIIPRRGSEYLGKVYIDGVGYRQAEDAGGWIKGFHIDVYVGIGYPSQEPSWNKTYKNVLYYGNNLY